jgi:hypothetical protein
MSMTRISACFCTNVGVMRFQIDFLHRGAQIGEEGGDRESAGGGVRRTEDSRGKSREALVVSRDEMATRKGLRRGAKL